jgi:ferredoxin
VDHNAFDRIIEAGGYISARAGSAPDANSLPVPKSDADLAMEAAACIGCGAGVAACPNSSAMLFVAAKVSHLGLLPQGLARDRSPPSRHRSSLPPADPIALVNARPRYAGFPELTRIPELDEHVARGESLMRRCGVGKRVDSRNR